MANNNVQNVRFLRNGSLYATREAALTGLNGQTLSAEQDGSIILARYGSGNGVKTLVGLVYVNGENKSLTIFDIDGASADVDALRQEINAKLGEGVTSGNTVTDQLQALSGDTGDTSADTSIEGAKRYADELISGLDYTGVTTGDGVYVTNVTETDGIISATTAVLPDATTVSGDSKVVIDVTQDKGQITATAANLTGVKLDGYTADTAATGDIASTDTLGQALAKLQTQVNATESAIDGLDYTGVTTGAGVYVTNVTEENGVVSATTATLPTVAAISEAGKPITAVSETLGEVSATTGTINAEYVNVTGSTFSSTNVQAALEEIETEYKAADEAIVGDATTSGDTLGKLEDRVENLEVEAKEYSIVEVTTGLPETVKVRYQLEDADGNVSGATVDIPKDSHIVSINYIKTGEHAQNLEYVYVDVSGNTQTTYVDMSELVLEAEFASGVTATDHVVHGVVDPTSEKDSNNDSFLTVGANGFKVDGIKDEIDAKINALDATGGTQTVATGKHVAVEVIEADGKITAVTVVEDNIADADDLTQEIADRQSGDTELSNRLGNGVTTANTATAQLAALSGDSSTAQSGDTSVEGAKKYADAKLADVVGDLDATVTGATSGNHVTISIEELDGKLVQSGLTIEENDIASASDLGAEIAARKAVDGVNGDAYTADTNANYISGASSLYGADQALDTALKAVEDKVDDVAEDYISGVTVNGTAVTNANNVAPIVISAATSATTATSTEAITVDTDANGNITLGLAGIDCGTY